MATHENLEGTDVPAPPSSTTTDTTISRTTWRRVLPGHKPDEAAFAGLLESWLNEHKPDTESYRDHVRRVAHADFALRHEESQYDEAHASLWGKAMKDWDAKDFKFSRDVKSRLDSAERTLTRWVNMVEKYKRARLLQMQGESRQSAKQKAAAPVQPNLLEEDANGGSANPSKASLLPYMQVIEVRVEHGETKTVYNPPNRNVVMMLKNMGRKNQSVRRILHLPEEIPFEYRWAERDEEDGEESPRLLEWVLAEGDYLSEIAKEEEAGRGHVLKSKQFPVRVRQLV